MDIPRAALEGIRAAAEAAELAGKHRDTLIRGVLLGMGVDPAQPFSLDLEAGTLEPIEEAGVEDDAT
jgi:hypothetical protein